jgi:hypothetical protein
MLQTRRVCEEAIKARPSSLEYIVDQTEDLCNLAVGIDPHALASVKNQTVEICQKALQKDGCAIRHVKNPTRYLCRFAVKHSSLAFFELPWEFQWECSTTKLIDVLSNVVAVVTCGNSKKRKREKESAAQI